MERSPDGAARVLLQDLDLGPELGDGGEGRVNEVRLEGAASRMVAKTYAAPLTEARVAQLTHLVRLAPHLPAVVEAMAWPQCLIVHERRVTGVLLPRAPDDCWADFTMRSGTTRRRLREVQYLLFPQAKLDRLGLTFAGLTQRLAVIGAVASALRLLHTLGMVYGDLSARNILYGAPPSVYLLDCDGVAVRGTPYVIDSPDWNDPSAPRTAQPATDIYKLGLLTTRMLTLNPTTRRAPAPGGTPAPLAATLRSMVDPDPAQRPTIDQVAGVLGECLPGMSAMDAPPPHWGMRPGTGELVRMAGQGDR